jgi:hypothetical protein
MKLRLNKSFSYRNARQKLPVLFKNEITILLEVEAVDNATLLRHFKNSTRTAEQ